VGIVATTRVSLPTQIKLGNCTNENSQTMFTSLCSKGQVTLPRQNSDHQVKNLEHRDMSRGLVQQPDIILAAFTEPKPEVALSKSWL
jgi:hypothetical protein